MATSPLHSDGEIDDLRPYDINPLAVSNGKRKSAFLPYKPKSNSNTVLTNLQRGNTEANCAQEITLSFHERCGQGEITEELVKNVKDIDVTDEFKYCPIHWACFYGQLSTTELLIKYGANVNKMAPDMITPLLLAASGGHHEVVRLLLQNGANVHHMDIAGNTPLMYAAAGNHPHTCNELLTHKLNINDTNENGDSAYSLAVEKNSPLAQAILENYLTSLLTL